MDEHIKSIIHEEYEKIKKRLEGVATLYGYRVDMNDVEMQIVAAYTMGLSEEQRKHYEQIDNVISLFGVRR
jgi:hypothetical protein